MHEWIGDWMSERMAFLNSHPVKRTMAEMALSQVRVPTPSAV